MPTGRERPTGYWWHMMLPEPRGALSADVFEALRSDPSRFGDSPPPAGDGSDDEAITLWALYELHHHGFEDVDDAMEWHPELLRIRLGLERGLEARLRDRWSGPAPEGDLTESLFAFVADHDGPSLARHVQTDGTDEQVLDLLRVRSIFHLQEADPTVWSVPRLPVAPKAALVEVLFDEYGAGDPNRLHHHLFARGLEAVGLRPEYGAYVDDVPTTVLEQNNAMALFGLHRRLRGAALGHFAAFEATSSEPSRRMADGLEHLGMAAAMVGYYTEHVTADAAHEQVAVRTVCGELVAAEPALRDDVFLGAFTCLDLEYRVARDLLDRWGVAT